MTEKTFAEIIAPQAYGYNVYPDKSVGVELELESKPGVYADDFASNNSNFWEYHHEESLRNGFELVFSKPHIPGTENYKKAMKLLDEFLSNNKKKLIVSYRTSLHIHVNIQHFTFPEIYNIVLNTYLFENLISYRSSANRKGNLFCMRGCDAEAAFYLLGEDIRKGYRQFEMVTMDSYKYGALNLASIRNRGTVEFRFMDATIDSTEIDLWVQGLSTFVQNAAKIDPKSLIEKIHSKTFNMKNEFKKITGPFFDFFASEIDFNHNTAQLMVLDNIFGIIHVLRMLNSQSTKKKFSYVTDDQIIPNPNINDELSVAGYQPLNGSDNF